MSIGHVPPSQDVHAHPAYHVERARPQTAIREYLPHLFLALAACLHMPQQAIASAAQRRAWSSGCVTMVAHHLVTGYASLAQRTGFLIGGPALVHPCIAFVFIQTPVTNFLHFRNNNHASSGISLKIPEKFQDISEFPYPNTEKDFMPIRQENSEMHLLDLHKIASHLNYIHFRK
jgi:hypothetical protein